MAFNGNLSEFGVVALLQLPGTNHLTGKLVLEQNDKKAEFFYIKGKLLHAELGEITGKEALVEVIDWDDGDFVFDSTSTSDKVTIKQDLQNTLMWALKERDERKKLKDEQEQAAKELAAQEKAQKEEERLLAAKEAAKEAAQAAAEAAAKPPEPILLPQSIMKESSSILGSFLINSNGHIIAKSEFEEDFLSEVNPMLIPVKSFIRDYPKRAVGKTFIEDSEFTLAIAGLSDKITTVIIVAKSTRMGVLNIELGKFIRALQASGLEILND